MKTVSNFTHPGGWTLHAIPPGGASPMENHQGGEIAADDADRRFIVHEVFLIFQGLSAIEKACASYSPSLPMKVKSKHRFATASSLEKIRESIVKFYSGSTVTLAEDGTDGKGRLQWSVSTGTGLCENVRVLAKGRGYVFESTEPA